MSQRFRLEEKLSQKHGENVLEYVQTYEKVCVNYKLPEV